MVTPGEAATIKVEPSLLKPAARTSSVPVMVNGSRCPASCSAAMPPARINSRQPWPVRFGSRPPAMPQTSINSPATGPMPNAGRSSWVEPVALLVPGTDNYRAGGHLDNPSALVADNQEEVGHGREADLRKAAHGHVPNLLPPRNHPMIMPEVRHWPASSSAALRAATLARICRVARGACCNAPGRRGVHFRPSLTGVRELRQREDPGAPGGAGVAAFHGVVRPVVRAAAGARQPAIGATAAGINGVRAGSAQTKCGLDAD